MLRPTTLFRAFAAAPRHIVPKYTPITPLARRFLTTAPEPTPSESTPAASATPLEDAPSSPAWPSPFRTPQGPPTAVKGTFAFHIGRSASGNFPVYQMSRAGGNKKLTVVKKVEGDAAAFQAELTTSLNLPADKVVYNQHTRHIVVLGHHKPLILEWLEKMGF
ncbi:hypothetical protein BT67DRAFT_426010 [Trichocladium antarcticum]|uniref:Large ribosomal subunit protein mL49 n=1 Tax=Trichocladium antarcticum TaxID=1450529 RepID=A0AAN6ZAR0_9PEZI|nr:hypothetical protein BT67DRAFT_426010 [Trichocladium antarcticum]